MLLFNMSQVRHEMHWIANVITYIIVHILKTTDGQTKFVPCYSIFLFHGSFTCNFLLREVILLICAHSAVNMFLLTNRFIYKHVCFLVHPRDFLHFYNKKTHADFYFILRCKKSLLLFINTKCGANMIFWSYKHRDNMHLYLKLLFFTFVLLSDRRKDILIQSISIRVAQ